MAGTRQSGTRSVAPTSGSVTSAGNSSAPNIQQIGGGATVINSSAVVKGYIISQSGTSTYAIIENNAHNVGNIINPTGLDSLVPIDQLLFSTTAERQQASAYFAGGVGIEKDLAVGGFIYGRIAAANSATTSSNVVILKTNEDATYYPLFTDATGLIEQGAILYADPLDGYDPSARGGLQYNPHSGKLTSERIYVDSIENSTSTTTGALVVAGGVGIGLDVNIGGVTTITNTINSADIANGALVVAGGVGIGLDVNIGGITTIINSATSTSTTNGALVVAGGVGIGLDVNIGGITTIINSATSTSTTNGALVVAGGVGIGLDVNIGGVTTLLSTATSTSATNGSLVVAGGVGIGENLNIDGITTIFNTATSTSATDGALVVAGGVGIGENLNIDGITTIFNTATSTSVTDGALVVAGGAGIGLDVNIGGVTEIQNETNSTSVTDGALVVTGGVGIGLDVNVGGNIYPKEINTGTIGAQDYEWADAYLNNVYSKFIGSTASSLTLAPGAGITDIFGDIRVRGQNPIGTAPIISNVLYVTMDGNDTNDGRAQDPSRACRTIGAAMNSPYYQPGTQIQVSPGRYLENNPLEMKPYTSVRGSDIRTTFIEPINKTQDLFHMNSGCYLNYMNFLNGRSGRLPGAYQQKFNRGAYATSFPPQTGDNRIDLFQSPYVQNCTNQSGPWLNDGTMFVPNQTVQVPSAVGMGSWEANTTTITVSVSTGTINIGHSINAGKQNPGFFDARTLLLANKPFIQSQTVAWVDATFNSGAFTYNQLKCTRDTGLVVNAIAMDLLQDSTSDSQFSGIQYWNQDSYTGNIPSEITATIAAITHLKSISLISSPTNQSTINGLYDKIINILTVGTSGITDDLSYGGLPSTNPAILSDYHYLQDNKSVLQENVINWITANYPALVYSQETCNRDVGYIVDSICFDLLHGGNVQSIKSGVYYYSYSNTSTLDATNEVPATTSAYNFMKSIISNIIEAKLIANPYQTSIAQVTGLNAGTARQSTTVKGLLDTITGIIRNGPEWAGPQIPINLTTNESTGVINAYNLLIANIPFIQAEVNSFINQTMNNFEYNRQLCYRDAGIILENLVYDAVFGGNEKSVESGKAYYRGVTSVIAGQETQTIGAIDHIVDLCEKILINEACDVITPPANIPSNNQVINTNLSGGEIIIPSLKKLANITTTIILNGPDSSPELYNGPGPDSAFVSAEILLQANRKFIQENIINYINYNLCYPPKALPYNQIKCKRDAGVIIDSIATDLLFPTPSNSQSTFSGVQYFNRTGYTGAIKEQLGPTIDAVTYLRDLSVKVVQNITTSTDAILGITRYTDAIQTTATNYATAAEVATIRSEFGIILTILNGRTTGWTDEIIPNGGIINPLPSIQNTVDLLQNNINYLSEEVVAYVNASNPGFTYSTSTCIRDIGYIIDSISFDLLYGGNRQAIQSGLSYYQSIGAETVIPDEVPQTVNAFTFIGTLASMLIQGETYYPRQTKVKPVLELDLGDSIAANSVVKIVSTITNIISNGPVVAETLIPISLTQATSTSTVNAYNILIANKNFIATETIKYLDETYNANSFNYDQELCYRDTGLIIDAVSQDILLGGNQKSREAGLSYWNQGYNYVSEQLTTTTLAINYVRDLALQVIANTPITSVTGTVATQVINPFYQYGGDYMPQEAIMRNFNIITDIIRNGPEVAPPIYAGGGLFILTGLNGSAVKIAPKVTSINEVDTNVYEIGLDTPTIGYGADATLYFGNTAIYPAQGPQVEAKSLEYTGSTSTWNERKIDSIGAIGGSLVDGGVISDRSPIQSFVYDAYTQLNQGGIGVKVTNNGYAQLVSVFTIFCDVGVLCDNGGIASITNSNCNFGNISLLAKGYGGRSFSGTVFNPTYRSYPFSPEGEGLPYLDQFYPDGYWPNQGGRVEIFVPDTANRPHIGLIMEVEPPKGHKNEQGFAGFLNIYPSTSTITTGTITLTGISTNDVFIGNNLYIRDQFGRQYDDNGVWYAGTGTVVTDVGYNSISLNQALGGGGDPTNPTYFTLYFCGNSYYTVQTSVVANQPYAPNNNILSENTDPLYQGPTVNQIAAHISSLEYLNTVVNNVIANIAVSPTAGNTATQVINQSVIGGTSARAFIDLRFGYMIDIIGADNITAAQQVVPQSQITITGSIPAGAGSAVTLITDNIEFMAEEIAAYVDVNLLGGIVSYNKSKCVRDVKLILQQLIYDLQTGGNYNSVYSGLSYWSRTGSYHIVELGEAVNRPDLFPDGAIVNFYQRSYISASGYLFEYVGAGTNYGALPQRGVADPVQSQETVQLNAGKVFFTSTDQNGDFRIGPGLVISQATGVLSGRTFVQSLYANMTPFILAIE